MWGCRGAPTGRGAVWAGQVRFRGFQTLESWRLTAFGERPDGGLPRGHRVANLRCVFLGVCFYREVRIHPQPRGQSPQPLQSQGAGTAPNTPADPRRGTESREARRRRQRPPAGSCLGFWVQTLRAGRELTPRGGKG